MKKEIFIALTCILLFVISPAISQDKSHEERVEKFKAEKVAFLTTNLDLSPAEAEKFWPIYNQMDKERWEAQKARRQLEDKVTAAEATLSEKEVIQLTRDYAGSLKQEADLMSAFNEKLLKVLPPKKVLNLYKTENEFRMNMIKKYRDNDKGPK